MKAYFALQYRMTNRWLRDWGLDPIITYPILIFAFFGLSIYLFQQTEFAIYIYLFSALTLAGKLSETRRNEFLKICFGDKRHRTIRIIENLICSLPFLVFVLYKQFFVYAALLVILMVILALVNFRTTLNYTLWTPFSKKPFEFSVGFRNNFHLFLAAYALTFVAVAVNNFNLGAFCLLAVFGATLSYYKEPENEFYVWIYHQSPREFLMDKIKTALLFSSGLALPVAIVLSIYFSENIDLLLLFFILGWAFLTATIVSKYSVYPDAMNIPEGILLMVCLFFPPILLVLIPYLFRKSENRLSRLLK